MVSHKMVAPDTVLISKLWYVLFFPTAASSNNNESNKSTPTIVGIALGVGVTVIVVLALVGLFLVYRYRSKRRLYKPWLNPNPLDATAGDNPTYMPNDCITGPLSVNVAADDTTTRQFSNPIYDFHEGEEDGAKADPADCQYASVEGSTIENVYATLQSDSFDDYATVQGEIKTGTCPENDAC